MQMREYRSKSPVPENAPSHPVPPAPVQGPPPLRFSIPCVILHIEATARASIVEAEFEKYTSSLSIEGTNILWFWEVSLVIIELCYNSLPQ